jgi:hypothetical protein
MWCRHSNVPEGSEFPNFELLESVKKWQKSLFHVKNATVEDLINLPLYVNTPQTEMKNWTFNLKNMFNSVNALHRVL